MVNAYCAINPNICFMFSSNYRKALKRLIKCSFVKAWVAKVCFLLIMLRVRGSWNTRVNACIMTYQCIFSSNYRKNLRRLMKCSFVQA